MTHTTTTAVEHRVRHLERISIVHSVALLLIAAAILMEALWG